MSRVNKTTNNLKKVWDWLDSASSNIDYDKLSLMMDLELADELFNLRLEELLNADNFNFVHDIVGIQRHIDREKKEIKRFLPRFSGKVV